MGRVATHWDALLCRVAAKRGVRLEIEASGGAVYVAAGLDIERGLEIVPAFSRDSTEERVSKARSNQGRRVVLASHVIFSTYGFWLPNDPRGSWSEFVGDWELFRFGTATKVDTCRSVAGASHDFARRMAAKTALKYPPVRFSGVQARAVGRGFSEFVGKSGLAVWACSIMPEHVHMVVARHRYPAEQVVTLLKGAGTRQLLRENLHPLAAFGVGGSRPPTPWGRGVWKVFLDDAEAVERAVGYVERNPLKEDKPAQRWSFVTAPEGDALRVASRLNGPREFGGIIV